MIAVEKGYFREAGIKVEVADLDTSTNSLAVVAQNRLQIVGGGLSAAYFNAVEKNLPVTVALDRVSSPLSHKLLVRTDLKDQIKTIAAAQRPTARQQLARLDHQLRDRQDLQDRRAVVPRRRPEVHSVPAGRARVRQQGGRRRLRHSALRGADRGARPRRHRRRSGRFRHAASDDDRGLFHQYRLGGEERRAREATISSPICAACAIIAKPTTTVRTAPR